MSCIVLCCVQLYFPYSTVVLQLSGSSIISTVVVTVLLEYLGHGVCSIRVVYVVLKYLNTVLYINEWLHIFKLIKDTRYIKDIW